MSALAVVENPAPVRLDLGCGKRKQEGFHGVDAMAFEGVDTVLNIVKRKPYVPGDNFYESWDNPQFEPWPWQDDSVDEIFSSHFVEHLNGKERIHFFNEAHRVLKKDCKAVIVTPDWSHACAYGDPTHQWPPMSQWYPMYLNKKWRDENAPHVPYTCDFDWAGGHTDDPWLTGRNDEFKADRKAHAINSARDLFVHLTKI